MPRRAIAAILEARRRGERSLVLLPRSKATRAGAGIEQVKRFVERVVPDARVERADRPGLEDRSLAEALEADVVVATEAALAEIERPQVTAAIALSVDSFLRRPTPTAAEETFQILWRLSALTARPGRTGRVIVETAIPEHHVIQALVRGSYDFFAEHELNERRETDSPPFRRFIRLRSVAFDAELLDELRSLEEVDLLGPAEGPRGSEVLLKVADPDRIVDSLRRMVMKTERRISVEVDPRDI